MDDLERVACKFGTDVVRGVGFHVIVGLVPLRVVARHDFQLRLFVLQPVLQMMNIFSGCVTLQAGKTIKQCES